MIKYKLDIGEMSKNLINESGVFIGDYFMLSVNGILTFFAVTATEKDKAYLIELKKNELADGTVELDERLIPSRKPQVILGCPNTAKGTTYRVTPIEIEGRICLPIEIGFSSPVLEEARKRGHNPIAGTYYATKMEIPLQLLWLGPDPPSCSQA